MGGMMGKGLLLAALLAPALASAEERVAVRAAMQIHLRVVDGCDDARHASAATPRSPHCPAPHQRSDQAVPPEQIQALSPQAPDGSLPPPTVTF